MARLDALPCDVRAHIDALAHDPLAAALTPCVRGCTQHPFFQPGAPHPAPPAVEPRVVLASMPARLRTLYARHGPNVEFAAAVDGWVFLSEEEVSARHANHRARGQARLVDLAVRYAGLGHVKVLCYDVQRDAVFETMDGGSNPYERLHNARARAAASVDDMPAEPFEDWCARAALLTGCGGGAAAPPAAC